MKKAMKWEYAYPFISSSIWGVSISGAAIVGRNGFSPIEITFFRFFLATLIFIPILFILNLRSDKIIPKSKHTWLMILGLSLSGVAVNNAFFYLGLERTTASMASLIVSLNPLMAMIFAVFMLGERFTLRKALSVILGIIGVGFIIGFTETSGQLEGNLLILIGITIWGSSFSFSRKCSEAGMSSIAITGWSEGLGSFILLPFILRSDSFSKLELIKGEILFWFLFMGILSSVLAYVIHYQAISVLGASTVAPSINIIPLSGVITAYLLLGESVAGFPIIGAIFVLSGVIIVQRESWNLSKIKKLQTVSELDYENLPQDSQP